MPNGINNWAFDDIVQFLKCHGFQPCKGAHSKKPGSHHYFHRNYLGKDYLVHIQYHGSKSIPTGTMKAVITTSGIPEKNGEGNE